MYRGWKNHCHTQLAEAIVNTSYLMFFGFISFYWQFVQSFIRITVPSIFMIKTTYGLVNNLVVTDANEIKVVGDDSDSKINKSEKDQSIKKKN